MKTLICLLLSILPARAAIIDVAANESAINSALSSAVRNVDTVRVAAGSFTAGATITITKGVRLLGGYGGATTITRSSDHFTITPDSTAISSEETIQVSGFTLDGNNTAIHFIHIDGAGSAATKPFKNLIITTNLCQNGGTGTTDAGIIDIGGQVRGVIAWNRFNRCNVIAKVMGNNVVGDWTNPAFTNTIAYGTSDQLFFENNTTYYSTSYAGEDPGWIESGQGARIVVRYNVWDMANTSQNELWDIHGFQGWPGGNVGTQVVEYYGNSCVNSSGYRSINHRGSKGLFFNNIFTGSGTLSMDLYGVITGGRCMTDVTPTPTYNGDVNDTYFFNNTDDGVMLSASVDQPSCGCSENDEFYNYNASFNGSTGVGRGTSAPVSSATTGVGYWQASTATPTTNSVVIQAGTFWKATATDTWTAYYQPYTYPHPLLAESGGGAAGTVAIGASGVLLRNGVTFQ